MFGNCAVGGVRGAGLRGGWSALQRCLGIWGNELFSMEGLLLLDSGRG